MALDRATLATLRFGTGFRPDQPAPADADALLAQIAAPAASGIDDDEMSRRIDLIADYRIAARASRKGDPAAEIRRKTHGRALRETIHADQIARMAGPVSAPHGFAERLLRFWSGHFTTARKNNMQGALIRPMQERAIRPHVGGRFADMLTAVTRNPAMLVYLDQNFSAGPHSKAARNRPERGLNENLAREILELHTLGVDGPYEQRDVREFARLLAGFSVAMPWREDRDATLRDDGFRFRRNLAEPGFKTVLGRRYGRADRVGTGQADVLDFLAHLAGREATAGFLARKMATHFVADAPPRALVAHMRAAYLAANRAGGADLRALSAAMLEHPAAWETPGAKVKKPWDLVVSGLRALGARPKDMRPKKRYGPHLTLRALRSMNQPMDLAPGPDGWEEPAQAWITPSGMAARLEWASRVGNAAPNRIDPRELARIALRDAVSRETGFAVAAAAEKWEGIALLLVSPDFNRV